MSVPHRSGLKVRQGPGPGRIENQRAIVQRSPIGRAVAAATDGDDQYRLLVELLVQRRVFLEITQRHGRGAPLHANAEDDGLAVQPIVRIEGPENAQVGVGEVLRVVAAAARA